jgi:hypothetical protein
MLGFTGQEVEVHLLNKDQAHPPQVNLVGVALLAYV